MQLNYKLLFALALLNFEAIATTQLSGGNEVGNGGDVIVCREGERISSIELLDFYEARVKSGQTIGKSGASETDIVQGILNDLRRVDAKRANLFEQRAKSFLMKTNFMKEAKLADIPDSLHLVLPAQKDCKIEQIAILDKHAQSSKKFLIDASLWEKLDPSQKAGLILHELIYEYFSHLGEKNSIKARAYNAFIFGKFDASTYWSFVRDLRMPIYK